MRLEHEFGPLVGPQSKVLILGSFPSVKSREVQFYYGHPQNRFWKLIAQICKEPVPVSIDEKKDFILAHRLALWDVIESCDVEGSSDASIREAKVNDLSVIFEQSRIEKICVNGTTAWKLFEKKMMPQALQFGLTEKDCMKLPSTSPANAAWSLQKLYDTWSVIGEYLCTE